nr:hypothetical protein [Tanacetum cinerariifolium]
AVALVVVVICLEVRVVSAVALVVVVICLEVRVVSGGAAGVGAAGVGAYEMGKIADAASCWLLKDTMVPKNKRVDDYV